jgi:hypothetical protein
MTDIFDISGDDEEYATRYAQRFGTTAKADISEVGEFVTSVGNVLTEDDGIESYWDQQLPQAGNIMMRETFAKTGQAALFAGSVAPMAYDYLFDNGTQAQDWYFENVVDGIGGDAVDYWTPNGGEIDAPVELVSNVLGGIGNFVMTGPAGFVATQQMTAGLEAARAGQEDAATMGVVRGAAAAVGAWLPVFGNTILSKLGIAALSNPAIGIAERATQQQIAEGEYAENFNPWDANAIAMDALMGMAFAGRSAIKGEVAPTVGDAVFGNKLMQAGASIKDRASFLKAQGELPGVHDALMVLANYHHRVYGSMPGRPVSPDVVHAHVNQLDSAVESLNRGEPVNVKAGNLEFESGKPAIVVGDEAASIKAEVSRIDEQLPVKQTKPKPVSKKPKEQAQDVEPVDADLKALIDERGDMDIQVNVINHLTGQVEAGTVGKASDALEYIRAEKQQADTLTAAIKEAATCILGL